MTVPSASSVSVLAPRRCRGDVRLAAELDEVGQPRGAAEQDRQDAFGHRVERAGVADALLGRQRRTLATTSCDVQPVRLVDVQDADDHRRSGFAMLALLLDGAHELHDAVASSQRAIEDELEVRRVAQVESLLQVVVQKARRRGSGARARPGPPLRHRRR